MSEDQPGKEQIAQQLQRELIEFALESDYKKLEEKLLPLVGLIKDVATIDVVSTLVDPEFQTGFEKAVFATDNISFIVEGKKKNPWQGGHAIVVLGSTGHIQGAVYEPTEGLEDYGDLTRYALLKAVYVLHLTKADRKGGLTNTDNWNYLVGLGLKPFDDVFSGAGDEPAHLENGDFYIGGSGCNAARDYLSELLGGATPTGDTQSGRFDRIFCSITADFLTNKLPFSTRVIPEPRELQELRINN